MHRQASALLKQCASTASPLHHSMLPIASAGVALRYAGSSASASSFLRSSPLLMKASNKSIFSDIEGGFGDRIPPSHTPVPTTATSPLHPPSGVDSASADVPTADDALDFSAVLVEESPVPGILILKLNNGPVNTLTLSVMRTLRYYLDLAAESAERRLGGAAAAGGNNAARARPNPWVEKANAKKASNNATATTQESQRHDELVKLFEGVRGLVLTSAVKNVFSAGLDLDELLRVGEGFEKHVAGVKLDVPYYATFTVYWSEFQSLWLTLHTLPIPIVAAINGDAPAAGCILSMCCDYRVMAIQSSQPSVNNEKPPRQYKIGITAARGGFCVPKFVAENMVWTMTTKNSAEEILTQGLLIPAPQAQSPKYGLVDALSDNDDTVLVDAVHVAERWGGLSSKRDSKAASSDIIPYLHTYWLIKYETRAGLVSMLDTKEKRLADLSEYINMLRDPSVYNALKTYRASLSSKPKK